MNSRSSRGNSIVFVRYTTTATLCTTTNLRGCRFSFFRCEDSLDCLPTRRGRFTRTFLFLLLLLLFLFLCVVRLGLATLCDCSIPNRFESNNTCLTAKNKTETSNKSSKTRRRGIDDLPRTLTLLVGFFCFFDFSACFCRSRDASAFFFFFLRAAASLFSMLAATLLAPFFL